MWQKLKIYFNRLIRNRFLQHLFFWCLSFLVLMNVLKVSAEVKTIDLIYAAIFHIPIVAVVYINLRLLFPFFLEKGKYLLYSLLILSLIALGSGFYLVLFNKWVDYFFEGYYFIAFYGFWDISLYFAVYLVATSLLRLARGWFRLQEIETERNKAELKALRSQINPHFLFNSLNSIYSLSRKNSKEVPEKIVQLSDLLRHIIYDSDRDFIPLEKEMEMIRNYITLQNLRTDEQHKINLQVDGEEKEKMIAPMIILPFVENSFKHGLKGGSDNAFVNILLTISDHKLDLEIANSKGKSANDTDLRYQGIGIENVRKRLEMLYPGKHKLKITETEQTFTVDLQIEIN
ncbi:histidine kinase [Maribellus sp. CM-23]|uniref:sensor histidine kinase n=1 Tax=Maribellus sp. CM-23 TaxID=2781026 RepID=UPI001F226EFB|nr:histidine kinase [Maribellus sp. CM-23]MCE4565137.1 histidine kinase [Maribellus sp. CM-23]